MTAAEYFEALKPRLPATLDEAHFKKPWTVSAHDILHVCSRRFGKATAMVEERRYRPLRRKLRS